MAKDGEDWNGLEVTILKSLANFFKMHEWWRSTFKASLQVRHEIKNGKNKNFFRSI